MQDPDRPRAVFHDELPEHRRMVRVPLIRTPAMKRVRSVVLSEKVHTIGTHYYRSRTIGCLKPNDCAPCDLHVEIRYKGYIAIYNRTTFEVLLLELTDHAVQPLIDHWRSVGSLHGVTIECWRDGKKDNSPVMARIVNGLDPTLNLPRCPDVEEVLDRIWFSRPFADPNPQVTPVLEASGNLALDRAQRSPVKPQAHTTNGKARKV